MGDVYYVHYNKSSTVLDIKIKLSSMAGLSVDRLRLIIQATVLKNDWNFYFNEAICKAGLNSVLQVGTIHLVTTS